MRSALCPIAPSGEGAKKQKHFQRKASVLLSCHKNRPVSGRGKCGEKSSNKSVKRKHISSSEGLKRRCLADLRPCCWNIRQLSAVGKKSLPSVYLLLVSLGVQKITHTHTHTHTQTHFFLTLINYPAREVNSRCCPAASGWKGRSSFWWTKVAQICILFLG